MIVYSIVILLAWFSCLWLPLWFASTLDEPKDHPTPKHHFMRG